MRLLLGNQILSMGFRKQPRVTCKMTVASSYPGHLRAALPRHTPKPFAMTPMIQQGVPKSFLFEFYERNCMTGSKNSRSLGLHVYRPREAIRSERGHVPMEHMLWLRSVPTGVLLGQRTSHSGANGNPKS